ncbi:MAG: hypothetical protein ACYCZR_01610 [Burkholderiales bacterium]
MGRTIDEAKKDFKRGILKSAIVESLDSSNQDFFIKFTSVVASDGDHELIVRATRERRMFKSIDSAVNTIREIGFKTITIKGVK